MVLESRHVFAKTVAVQMDISYRRHVPEGGARVVMTSMADDRAASEGELAVHYIYRCEIRRCGGALATRRHP